MIGALFSERKEFLTAPAGSWQVGYVDVMTEGSPKLSSFTRLDFSFSFIVRICSLFSSSLDLPLLHVYNVWCSARQVL